MSPSVGVRLPEGEPHLVHARSSRRCGGPCRCGTKTGVTAEYTALPVIVLGTLEVGEERDGRFVTSLYRLTDATEQR